MDFGIFLLPRGRHRIPIMGWIQYLDGDDTAYNIHAQLFNPPVLSLQIEKFGMVELWHKFAFAPRPGNNNNAFMDRASGMGIYDFPIDNSYY